MCKSGYERNGSNRVHVRWSMLMLVQCTNWRWGHWTNSNISASDVPVLTSRKVTSKKKKKCYVFLDAWDFKSLAGCFAFMWEILHAWRESVRNSVQAWDSCSMHESWQPCKLVGVYEYRVIDYELCFYFPFHNSRKQKTKFDFVKGILLWT